jgi:tetratricopeptide (TPR) repeat protein
MTALRTHLVNRREWNGFLVSMLIDLRAKEALPLIREAYAASRVDRETCGDYGSVLLEITGKIDPHDPLVTMCQHCNLPEVLCRRRAQADNDRAATQALNEGTALFNTDRIREAFPVLCKAVTCSSVLSDSIDGCSARFLRARCLMALNRFEEAASDCSELLHLLGLKDLWWRAKLLRAEAHRERGHVEEAVNDVVAVLDELPDNTEAVALMAQFAEKDRLTLSSQQSIAAIFDVPS